MATTVIVGAIVFCFLGGWLLSSNPENPFWKYLPYNPESMPWTLLTYPFVRGIDSVIWFALTCFITHQFLGDLERRLGPYGAALLFFAYTFLGGLCYFLGTLVFGALPVLGIIAPVYLWVGRHRWGGGSLVLLGLAPAAPVFAIDVELAAWFAAGGLWVVGLTHVLAPRLERRGGRV